MTSFKKEVIRTFQTLHKIEGLENNRLIVYTPAGTFVGTPLLLEEDVEDNNINKSIFSLLQSVAKDYRSENGIPENQNLDNNDGCFLLSDVTLITGNSKNHIPVLVLFYDQITGISIGNLS